MKPNQKHLRYRGVEYYREGPNYVSADLYQRKTLELAWLKERLKNIELYEEYLQHLCSVKEDTES
jgi:hypothetical protein